MDMFELIIREPLWLRLWIFWMMVVNTASVFFMQHRDARFTFYVWIGNAITMTALFQANGYNRLLGLSHVVWWTPLLVHLWLHRASAPAGTRYAAWLKALIATNAASLVIDYIDVARYMLGDRT